MFQFIPTLKPLGFLETRFVKSKDIWDVRFERCRDKHEKYDTIKDEILKEAFNRMVELKDYIDKLGIEIIDDFAIYPTSGRSENYHLTYKNKALNVLCKHNVYSTYDMDITLDDKGLKGDPTGDFFDAYETLFNKLKDIINGKDLDKDISNAQELLNKLKEKRMD